MHGDAAIIVIGNEVLSGKIQEDNSQYLVRELRALGTPVAVIHIVPDEVEVIGHFVELEAAQRTHVLTTGGVGPTHDDVTMAGVAHGLGLRLERHPEIEALVRRHYVGLVNEAALKLADLPAGAQLLYDGGLRIPQVRLRNVWIFPGDPDLLREKFQAVRRHFAGRPFHLRQLHTEVEEIQIAALLIEAERRHPGVLVGSYPRYDPSGPKVKLTVEGRDEAAVRGAADYIAAGLPPGTLKGREP